MWIYQGSTIPAHLLADVETKARREDCTDGVWLNIDTGARIILACDGGWREPETSRYRVLHYAPGETVATDATWGILGSLNLRFDPTQQGNGCYAQVKQDGFNAINAFLGIENQLM